MDYRIVEKPAFQVLGKAVRVSTVNGENQKTIPAFWGQLVEDGTHKLLTDLKPGYGVIGPSVLGICAEFRHDLQEFTYMIAVEKAAQSVPDGFVEKPIPAATWAVFESVGAMPEAIQKVWGRIFSEFFPSSGFEHAPGGPELEVYPIGDAFADDYKCEVWIPIVKKA